MPEIADAPEATKEHYSARLKREHAEQGEEIARLKARVAELESGVGASANVPAAQAEKPAEAPALTPEAFVPSCVAALLAGGVKATDLAPLVQVAYSSTLDLIRGMNGPKAPVIQNINARSERARLQEEWALKDKAAQGENHQVKIKRDAAARTTSQVEREVLTEEVNSHMARLGTLVAECKIIEGKIKAIEATL